MKTWIAILLLVFLALPTAFVQAADSRANLDTTIDPADQAQFDQILQPVMTIYNFIKYIASVVAVIFLLYAGISFMSSGNDPKQRDAAKSIATYVVIGLLIIWAAPMIVQLLI